MKSFRIERPSIPNRAPPWDLILVLAFLRSSDFEPFFSVSLRQLTVKTLFLVSLSTATGSPKFRLYLGVTFFR